MQDKPFSQACENNKAPILAVLEQVFIDARRVLEIGSGTGQHAVHFAQALTHVQWQPTDLAQNLPGMRLWFEEAQLSNIAPAIELDVTRQPWFDESTGPRFDAVFSANTLHIMGKPDVKYFFDGLPGCTDHDADLCIYGPFNFGGRYTSASNAQFDQWLYARDPRSAIRDFEWVDQLASDAGFDFVANHAMPANNRLLHWRKSA